MGAEVVTSTATRAAQGFAIGGPYGAAIGAVVGAVEGIFKSKSRKSQKKAFKEQTRMDERQVAMQRWAMVRQARIARQQAVAAVYNEGQGVASSPGAGAIGSIGAQLSFNQQYFDNQVASNRAINAYGKKAQKYADNAGIIGSVADVGTSLALGMGYSPSNPIIKDWRKPQSLPPNSSEIVIPSKGNV